MFFVTFSYSKMKSEKKEFFYFSNQKTFCQGKNSEQPRPQGGNIPPTRAQNPRTTIPGILFAVPFTGLTHYGSL